MRRLVIAFVLAVPLTAVSDDLTMKKSSDEVNALSWFSEFGASTNSGVTFQEKAQGWGFTPGWAVGPDVMIGLLRYRFHRVFLKLGYLYYGVDRRDGTEQIEVTTSYQRINLTANYDFCYKILVVGTHVGTSMMIVRTGAVLRDFDVLVSGNELSYENHSIVDQVEATGVDFGFLTGLSVGLDLDPLFKKNTYRRWLNFELRLTGDYLRYSERDGFFAGAGIAYWPFG
jgi:hypothetical protein